MDSVLKITKTFSHTLIQKKDEKTGNEAKVVTNPLASMIRDGGEKNNDKVDELRRRVAKYLEEPMEQQTRKKGKEITAKGRSNSLATRFVILFVRKDIY